MEGFYAQNCSLKSNVNYVGSGRDITVIATGKGGGKIFTARGASNFTVRDLSVICDSAVATYLTDSLTTAGCKNVLYYDCMFYTKAPVTGNAIQCIFKAQAGDSIQVINCDFGIGTRFVTTAGAGHGCITVSMTGGVVNLKKVTQLDNTGQFGIQIPSKTGGVLDVRDCSFAAISYGGGGIPCRLDEDQTLGTDYFSNCTFWGNGVDAAFYNTGAGASSYIRAQGCIFYGTYTPSAAAAQTNYVSGKIFCTTNPILQTGWGAAGSHWLNIEWQANATGEYGGFHYGSVDFDTINGLSVAPHAGYLQYKSAASPGDTMWAYMDGGWRNVDRTWSTGRDSVLVNQASDTLAVTGIQTTSFVEVQLESDPGVNIGCPYHTKTANQDILIWPVACVNKFYYRWRIH
jgi:hypothetical protein